MYARYTDPDTEGYFEGPTQAEILLPAMMYVAELGTADADNYEKVAPAKDIFNAYKSYLSTFDKATQLDNAELKSVMDEQAAALKASYSNVDQRKQFETKINFLVQRATITQTLPIVHQAAGAATQVLLTSMLAATLKSGTPTQSTCIR